MVQAYQHEIVLPNKHKNPPEAFYEGHLLESETYVATSSMDFFSSTSILNLRA
jgi:hypothetical protein